MVFRFSTTPCTRCKPVKSSSREIRNFMRFSPFIVAQSHKAVFDPPTLSAKAVFIERTCHSRVHTSKRA